MSFNLTSIIVIKSSLARLLGCVASIRQYTDPRTTPYEIIAALDGTDDGTSEWCVGERIAFVRLTGSEGFPAACNRGMRMATGEQLLLLHDDTIVTRNWLSNLLTALRSSPEIGIVGPIANRASGRQRVNRPFADLAEFQRSAAETNHSDPAMWEPSLRIAGFCLLLKRTVYERVGELDERYASGYYADDDYCFRTWRLGYGLRICRDTYIYHEGGAGFRPCHTAEPQELLRRNRRIFIDKWDVDPDWHIEHKEESG